MVRSPSFGSLPDLRCPPIRQARPVRRSLRSTDRSGPPALSNPRGSLALSNIGHLRRHDSLCAITPRRLTHLFLSALSAPRHGSPLSSVGALYHYGSLQQFGAVDHV